MTSSRVISFRQVRDVPNEHDFVDLLRYVGIFQLIIWKRIDDVFVIVIVFVLVRNISIVFKWFLYWIIGMMDNTLGANEAKLSASKTKLRFEMATDVTDQQRESSRMDTITRSLGWNKRDKFLIIKDTIVVWSGRKRGDSTDNNFACGCKIQLFGGRTPS
jgi:hypothetical protein